MLPGGGYSTPYPDAEHDAVSQLQYPARVAALRVGGKSPAEVPQVPAKYKGCNVESVDSRVFAGVTQASSPQTQRQEVFYCCWRCGHNQVV